MTTTTEPQTQPADITAFLTDLARTAKAEKTRRVYRSARRCPPLAFAPVRPRRRHDGLAAGQFDRPVQRVGGRPPDGVVRHRAMGV